MSPMRTTELSTEVAVDVRAVTKVFGAQTDQSVTALDQVSVSINQNEFFTLLGPSGCGKTTLLRLVAGFDHPNEGAILLDGDDISPLPPHQRPVNTVFQNYAHFPHMTVAQNIAFGLEMQKRPKTEISDTVREMLAMVHMDQLKDRFISQISGGQQQRVALARALAPRPKVLLLDEPLSALDLKLRKEMQLELKRLQHETGITFIFVTHDQEEALTMSDRVAVMNEGKILQIGSPQEIYDHPTNRFVANFIGESNVLTADLLDINSTVGTVQLPGGAELIASLPDTLPPTRKVAVIIRPEHAVISDDTNQIHLKGTINNRVYFGTDTHYYLTLDSGEDFVVRQQNRRNDAAQFRTGSLVNISISENATQVLAD